MRIFVTITAPNASEDSDGETYIGVSFTWVMNNTLTSNFPRTEVSIHWSDLSTATSLNSAIKQAVIDDIFINTGYAADLLFDKFFFMGGFVGI